MIRSSRGGRPEDFSGGAKSSSSALSSSRSISPIAPLFLEAHEGGRAFGHLVLPGVGRRDRRQPAPLLLELGSPDREGLCLFRSQGRALGGDRRLDLYEPFLGHALGENRIGLAERID